jgi:hypothetical protein
MLMPAHYWGALSPESAQLLPANADPNVRPIPYVS